MPFLLDDLKSNKLYRKKVFMPINKSDKKHGSAVFLLAPTIENVISLINMPDRFVNNNLFNSYYMEKDINLIINESTVLNEDRDVDKEEVALYKYTRNITSSSYEIKDITGCDTTGNSFCVSFSDESEKTVAWVIVSGKVILYADTISNKLDKDIMEFAVNVLYCTCASTKLDKKYKYILKNKYDFKFDSSTGFGYLSNFFSLEQAMNEGTTLLTESMSRIDVEIALWNAQAKILQTILDNYDDETWMHVHYKSMKAKLNKIPLPGFKQELRDTKEKIKDYLDNVRYTIEFMTEMAAFEIKDQYDLEDITKKYISWVKSTKSSKAFKLKCIREVKASYKETIKLYKYNLKRYEAQSTLEKRTENVVALIGKVCSIFSFLTGGSLAVLKNTVLKSILPKSSKTNVLSTAELEAKIDAYEKIVEELDKLEDEIKAEPTNEFMAMSGMNPVVGIDNKHIVKNKMIGEEDDEGEPVSEALTAEQRKKLKDSDFGLPAKRAYPMPDKSHVKSAIQMFNHVDKKDEKTLANAILTKINQFHMEDEVTISKKNRLYKYIPEAMKEEAFLAPLSESVLFTDDYVRSNESATYFESEMDSILEDSTYNKSLKRVLYSERIRNQKDILDRYRNIKENCKFIKYTYLELDKYESKNIYIDMSHYINSFIKHNYLKLDKGINLYFELINRFLNDKRLKKNKYTKRTVMIPVDCWKVEKDTDIWDYKFNINPISIFFRLLYTGQIYKIQEAFKDVDFIFIGVNGFFKLSVNDIDKKMMYRFKDNITKLINRDIIDDDEVGMSKDSLYASIVDKFETPDIYMADTETGVKINNLVGDASVNPLDAPMDKTDVKNKIDDAEVKTDSIETDKKKANINKQKTEELKEKIKYAADKTGDEEKALELLNNDEDTKRIIEDIKMTSPNSVDYSPTRVARINSLNDKFLSTKYKNETVRDMLAFGVGRPLEKTSVPIDSTNQEWKELTGANLAKAYDVNEDIYSIIYHFGRCTVPVAVRDIKIEDTSTSEDAVCTYTIQCEDIKGKRFTLKFDVPKVINNRFMKLRGNEKVMSNQLMNLPIIKTGANTVQITSNYNKIFIEPMGLNVGKSIVTSDRLIKAINKYKGKNITFVRGDNTLVCRKYELPIDYIDLSSQFMEIKLETDYTIQRFLFNQDNIQKEYAELIKKDNMVDYFPIGVRYYKKSKKTEMIYYNDSIPTSSIIASILCGWDKEFSDVYTATSVSNKYTYSNASIMNTNIPVAVLIGYSIGLFGLLDRAQIDYEVSNNRPKYDKSNHDIIKLKDAYILYRITYDSSMLLNGLKSCNLEDYSIKEVNNKSMWLEFLDIYGGRLNSDGFDMFYDLMLDPITKNVCREFRLPTDYIDCLLYANILLVDNKYNKHTDITGNRFRNNEIIAGYTYKALCNSYSQYRRGLRAGREVPMTIKQSAVIDLIMSDSTESDYSSLSPLLEFEAANGVSFKGLSGMNSDRSYSLDKRTFDESMVNVLAMSTGFAANAGVNRQSTIDPNIDTTRGYIKSNPDDLNITKTFCMTEALTPYGVTSDDSFRTAMTFIQTAKHSMRTDKGDPMLVSTGADEALVYLTSDTFSYKAKGTGKVIEKTDDYMVIQYDKNCIVNPTTYKYTNTEVVDLRKKMTKNSDGGFYQAIKLDSDYKVGDSVKPNDVVAIDKLAYNNTVGPTNNYAYNIGTFCKFAIMMSDEGFEDSCRSTHWLAKAMSSTVVEEQEYNFNKDTNIYYMVKKGDKVQEGQPILIFQNAFEDEDANALVRALKADNNDVVEEIGRITLKSKVTGTVEDIKVKRCVETNECSPTLQKIIKDYDKSVGQINKVFNKYDEQKAKGADPTYKLEATGKLKNSVDSVLITIYISYQDDFGVSDKTVCYSALKGVSSKELIPEGKEAYGTFRPGEKIHYIQSEIGDMKRMVGSVYKIGALNKVLVELQRSMCDIMGIKWKYFDEQ